MAELDIFNKQLVIFSGKGGVGKSTVAASFAGLAASKGKKVLVVEVSHEDVIPALFDFVVPSSYTYEQPITITEGVDTLNMHFPIIMREFFSRYMGGKVAGKVLASDSISSFMSVLPGVEETIFLGKIIQLVLDREDGKNDYDMVVYDAPATGHALQLFGTPQVLRSFIDKGFIFEKMKRITMVLEDPKRTLFNLVALAEDTVVAETEQLREQVENKLNIPLGYLFLNQLETFLDITAHETACLPKLKKVLAGKPLGDHFDDSYEAFQDLISYEKNVVESQSQAIEKLYEIHGKAILPIPRSVKPISNFGLIKYLGQMMDQSGVLHGQSL